jgi:hypothetical protein
MNPAYKETFARHRMLFSLPVVLAAMVSLLFVLSAPKVYQAEAKLWVDNAVPGSSSLDKPNPAVPTPATQAQEVLSELLVTRRFRIAVGNRGGLTKYLAEHSSTGFSPLAQLRGKEPLDNRVALALDPKHVIASVAGPQLLAVTLKGPEPAVAANTLSALIYQFKLERSELAVQRQEGLVEYFRRHVETATAAQQTASTPQEASAAATQLARMTRALNQAQLNLLALQHQGGAFEIVPQDLPKPPPGPVSGKKKAVFAVVAGLFVGALVSFLGIVLLSGREERRVVLPADEHEEPEETVVPEPEPEEHLDADWLPTSSGLEYHAQANGSNGSHDGSPEVERPPADVDRMRE